MYVISQLSFLFWCSKPEICGGMHARFTPRRRSILPISWGGPLQHLQDHLAGPAKERLSRIWEPLGPCSFVAVLPLLPGCLGELSRSHATRAPRPVRRECETKTKRREFCGLPFLCVRCGLGSSACIISSAAGSASVIGTAAGAVARVTSTSGLLLTWLFPSRKMLTVDWPTQVWMREQMGRSAEIAKLFRWRTCLITSRFLREGPFLLSSSDLDVLLTV